MTLLKKDDVRTAHEASKDTVIVLNERMMCVVVTVDGASRAS